MSLDPSGGGGGGTVQLICWLDDKHLPCVPPVSVSVPEDYPATPPKCHLAAHEHSATTFLATVSFSIFELFPRKINNVDASVHKRSVLELLSARVLPVRNGPARAQSSFAIATILFPWKNWIAHAQNRSRPPKTLENYQALYFHTRLGQHCRLALANYPRNSRCRNCWTLGRWR